MLLPRLPWPVAHWTRVLLDRRAVGKPTEVCDAAVRLGEVATLFLLDLAYNAPEDGEEIGGAPMIFRDLVDLLSRTLSGHSVQELARPWSPSRRAAPPAVLARPVSSRTLCS